MISSFVVVVFALMVGIHFIHRPIALQKPFLNDLTRFHMVSKSGSTTKLSTSPQTVPSCKYSIIDTGLPSSGRYISFQVCSDTLCVSHLIQRLVNPFDITGEKELGNWERIDQIYYGEDPIRAFGTEYVLNSRQYKVDDPIYKYLYPVQVGINRYVIAPDDPSVMYLVNHGRYTIMGGRVDRQLFAYLLLNGNNYYLVTGKKTVYGAAIPNTILETSIKWLPLKLGNLVSKDSGWRGLPPGYSKILGLGECTLLYTWSIDCLIAVRGNKAAYYSLSDILNQSLGVPGKSVYEIEGIAANGNSIYCILSNSIENDKSQYQTTESLYLALIEINMNSGTIGNVNILGAIRIIPSEYITCDVFRDQLIILTWGGTGSTQKAILVNLN